MRQVIAIDIGTAYTRIFQQEEGILLSEPTIVAYDKESGNLICAGEAARRMVGRAPSNIEILRPIRDGVIYSFQYASLLLESFIKQVLPTHPFFRPDVIFTCPEGVTELEKRAFYQLFEKAFPYARGLYLIPATCACGIGCELPLEKACGSMVAQLGAGISALSVFTLGDRAVSLSVKRASEAFDDAIISQIRTQARAEIGWKTAEQIKTSIASLTYDKRLQQESLSVTGRDLISSLPRNLDISQQMASLAIADEVHRFSDFLKEGLEKVLPELSGDLFHNGIYLCGGGALLRGLDTFLSQTLKIPIHLPDEAAEVGVIGAAKALMEKERYCAFVTSLKSIQKR